MRYNSSRYIFFIRQSQRTFRRLDEAQPAAANTKEDANAAKTQSPFLIIFPLKSYALFALPKTLTILCFTISFIIARASPRY